MRPNLPEGAIELGSDHWYVVTNNSKQSRERHGAPEVGGIIEYHLQPDGKLCGGSVRFWRAPGDSGPVWQVHSMEPLDIHPSVHCMACGSHGWIHGGKWEQA